MKKAIVFLAILVGCAVSVPATDCTMVGAVGRATRDGVTLLAKNRDYPPDAGQVLLLLPDQVSPAGAELQVQQLRIPQARETYRLLGFRSLDDRHRDSTLWRWGLGMGLNRHQVAVACNDANSWDLFEGPALHDNDITRLLLERCRTAREAVDLVAQLLADHPLQIPEIYTVGDPREVWIIEATGNHWAAVRIEHGTFARANRFEIVTPDLPDDSGGFRQSRRDLVESARASGHYQEEAGRFSFRRSYSKDYAGPDNTLYNETRLRRVTGLLEKIEGRATVENLAAILRDHYENWTFEPAQGTAVRLDAGPADPHCNPANPLRAGTPVRTVCYGKTVGAMVAQVDPRSPEELGGTMWACLHLPCLNAFIPLFPNLPDGLPTTVKVAGERYETGSLWWQLAAVSRNLERNWAGNESRIGAIRGTWRKLETWALREWSGKTAKARRLCAEGRSGEAERLLSGFQAECWRRLEKNLAETRRRLPGFDPLAPVPAALAQPAPPQPECEKK